MFVLKKSFVGIPETERGRPFILRGDPKEEKIVYGVSNSVIIRDAADPSICEIVTHHSKKVTAVSYSPSGYYICSGDAGGQIKIWDTVNEEHAVKYEYQLMAGNIYDMCWSEDSKKIALIGEGRDKYGVVISWDTGTNVGGISCHLKTLLSCDFRQARPFAIVTAGEDMTLIHHKGPPFKYDKKIELHTNFINCVRYNKEGSLVASAAMDGKINIYDGQTLDFKYELIAEGKQRAHEGGVYSISWSGCGKKLLSASGDKTCKTWDVVEKKCLCVFDMGKDVLDQQLGCLWLKDNLISVSLSGRINFLNPDNPSVLRRSFWGHNKSLVCGAISSDKKKIISGSHDGILNLWDVDTGECSPLSGVKFSSQVTAVATKDDEVAAVGIGKVVKFASISGCHYHPETIATDTECTCLAMVNSDSCVIGCQKSIDLIQNRKMTHSLSVSYEVLSVASYNGSKVLACGSDKKLHFFSVEGSKLVAETKEINIGLALGAVTVSRDGKRILVVVNAKYIYLYNAESLAEERRWMANSARVTVVEFSNDEKYFATSGLDGAIRIFNPEERNYRIENLSAHRSYYCRAVLWVSGSSVASVGQQDCAIKFWDVKFS